MFAACWSVKGGSGTTVVAAALAVLLARRPPGALLVDLAGDQPAVLGLAEVEGLGLADWLAAGPEVPAEGLHRLEVEVGAGLAVLPRGRGPLHPVERADVLAGLLADEERSVVVDCGRPTWDPAGADAATVLAGAAAHSLLVTRACYLALRRLSSCPLQPTGVVLVREPGRALGRREVEEVTRAEVVAEVQVDPRVARAVDAGLLAHRLPTVLERALGQAR